MEENYEHVHAVKCKFSSLVYKNNFSNNIIIIKTEQHLLLTVIISLMAMKLYLLIILTLTYILCNIQKTGLIS